MSKGRVALLVVVLLGAALFALRAPLATRVMRRVVERNLAADPIAALPDGLHVALCGSGSPIPDPERAEACTAVVAGRSLFVVDVGGGAGRSLTRLGLAPGGVEAVFVTHFHSDHVGGLGELALLRWTGAARETPLPVYGPAGVEEVVAGFDRAYAQDSTYRTAHHGPEVVPPGGAGMSARPFPAPERGAERVVFEGEGLRVTAFAVDHEPVLPAVGYRFDYGGRAVVVSGDTKPSGEVERMARGADLLVHEALAADLVEQLREGARAAGRSNVAQILGDIPDYHTTPVDAAKLAASAGVKHLLYTHVVPPLPLPGLEAAFLEGVSQAYAGEVTLGSDGTWASLPKGSEAIEVSQR